MTDEPAIAILLDGNGRVYRPGETLAGEYKLIDPPPTPLKSLEVSIVWFTEGKGEEDLAVHEFERINASDDQPLDPQSPRRFSTSLPKSPLTYDGRIVKIRWCVRVRAFFLRGKEVFAQKFFRLGDIAAAREL
jgi:hypothetical protein